jgi:hypothetical protein
MGAFDDISNITLPDPGQPEEAAAFRKKNKWEPHEQVILKGAYTIHEQEIVGNGSSVTDPKKGVTFQMGTGRVKLMQVMIVGWTFTRNGQPIPVSVESIRRLPVNYSSPILEKCDELAQTMTEEEQTDFFPGVNGHIGDDSIETKLSLKLL